MESVRIMVKIGMLMRYAGPKRDILNRTLFNKIVKNPINTAVIMDKVYVARTFSVHDFLLNSPRIMSFDVLAMNGPLIFPLRDNKAGIINMRMRKL